MAAINKLTAKQIVSLPVGLHSDGGNLYVSVRPGGSRQWVMRYRFGGRQRELGLGGAGPHGLSLAAARTSAESVRAQLRQGLDPLNQREASAKAVRVPTFREAMDDHIARNEELWKSRKSAPQWRASLKTHAASLMDQRVDAIDANAVIAVLDPIWHQLPETAKRVRGRIEAILSMAKTRGFRTGENPAAWRDNLDNVFPAKPKLVRGHFKAMDHAEIPSFMTRMRATDSMSALVLEWIILTALRPTVGVTATWGEVNRSARTWTISAERMKGRKGARHTSEDHIVPLCDRAIEILDRVEGLRITKADDELLFPSQRLRPLSLTALEHCRERMGVYVTTHGFRATFRTWVDSATFHEAALAEKALGHLVGDETVRAYNRGHLLEKRRRLMTDWADYLAGRIDPKRNPFVIQGEVVPQSVLDEVRGRRPL
ncbi:tyrosine-type recombinase/integrase [Methylobacterium aerolatum]|uniref:Integrase n=1 Tax=Methylobacterium aerolatum TaxID=418708 RepID=A0ABU0I1A4_9HYPH|nr:site-specific integrase [Methylobacterium aerolatum]MDQ0448389.1 integrase [Methylobacterium aerolatum]GJD34471.1 Prophage integrase IntA [Methylobacterium aerolatum]